jgi:hypothetical protein
MRVQLKSFQEFLTLAELDAGNRPSIELPKDDIR